VAASFAAILAVYAAGHWRTRDEARRLGAQAQARRPQPPLPAVPAVPIPIPVPVPAPTRPLDAGKPKVESTASSKVAATLSPVPIEQVVAPEPEVVAAEEAEPVPQLAAPWHDGYYTGWGQSFHGDIEARVTIKDGRIVEAGIATCATRYPCYVIDTILHQPVERQSPDVDRVSRATESADAYYGGLVQALQKAEAEPAAAPAIPQ
jgi:uncharacterized protein with FMN-binding domain